MIRFLKIALFITFLICYLDFGHDGSGFIGQIEYLVIKNLNADISSLQNPLFILALIGQILILISVFNSNHSNGLIFLGIKLLGVIVLLILIFGIFLLNLKMIVSTIPFIVVVILYIVKVKSKRRSGSNYQAD
jgi:hypothetical protein